MYTPTTTDRETTAYFDSHTPEYSTERLRPAAAFLRDHAKPGDSLVDVGCGVGNTLEYLAGTTGIDQLAGIDVSANCLEQTRKRVGCETHLGSILDSELVRPIEGRFDFAIVAAVLHHLVGPTRRASRANARLAIVNTLRLLRPGGYLIVHEPVFGPRAGMDAVFHLKRAVSRFTDQRVPLLGYWGNVGQPVVSYYSVNELQGLLGAADEGSQSQIAAEHVEPHTLTKPLRWLVSRADVTIALFRP